MLKTKSLVRGKVSIPKQEYKRLKNLDQRLGQMMTYFGYLQDIQQSRREAKMGEVISQADLFQKLNLS